jgi:hypothetical protein
MEWYGILLTSLIARAMDPGPWLAKKGVRLRLCRTAPHSFLGSPINGTHTGAMTLAPER